MMVTYRGDTNFQYVLQVSSNGVSWNPLLTNLATTQPMNYFDAQWSSNRSRLYKATAFKTPFMYQGTFSGGIGDRGGFMMFLRTNNTITFIGTNISQRVGEYGNGIMVVTNGTFCTNLNVGAICCTFSSNTVSGSFTNPLNRVSPLTGTQKPNVGAFRSYAGYYTGSYTGDSCSGTIEALVSADGTFFLSARDSTNGKIDGGFNQLNVAPGMGFTVDTVSQPFTHYICSWGGTPFAPTIFGSYHFGCGGGDTGVFSLTRQESSY